MSEAHHSALRMLPKARVLMLNLRWLSAGAASDPTADAAPKQPGSSAPQPDPAAAQAAEAHPEQEEGGPSEGPVHAATRRTAGPSAAGPPLYLSGNHIQRPQRLRKLSEEQQKLRRRVRPPCSELLMLAAYLTAASYLVLSALQYPEHLTCLLSAARIAAGAVLDAS